MLCVILCWPSVSLSQERPKGPMSETEMREARKKAAHRRRRVIMNNDGNDCRNPKPDEPKTPENFLSKRTSPLLGSHVDAIFYCTGVFNSYTQKSDETELRGHGDQFAVDWAWELGKQGRDALAIMVDFGHQNGIEVFWSMRMNDTHDSADGALLCQWKKDHPGCLMGKKGDKFAAGGGRWSAVNYGLPEVRDKVFRILQDVCARYDVDGIEMDFFRHPVYFKPQMLGEPVTQEHCDQMSDLLRRVRKMTEEVAAKRGRPLLIAARTPDSVGYCRGIGLDIERWLKDDLIDLWVLTCYFQLNPWEESVKLGHKYGVRVYPSLSESRIKDAAGKLRNSLESYRGRAMNVWNSGADGVYLFNQFNPRHPLWRELGDPPALQKLDKLYFVSPRGSNDAKRWLAGGDRFITLPRLSPENPLTLKPGEKRAVALPVGEDLRRGTPQTPLPELILKIQVTKLAVAEALSVTLNGTPLGARNLLGDCLQLSPSPELTARGSNLLELALKPGTQEALTLRDLYLTVRHKNPH